MSAAVLFQGFVLSASLIVAIGAQNTFLLRQGLRREYVFTLATLCFVSDATLIALGCGGFGALVQAHPQLIVAVTWIGALFLIGYGLRNAWSALHPEPLDSGDAPAVADDYRRSVLSMLALTWLNPHVYLDTVLLLGGIAGRYAGMDRIAFALGAMSASGIWFYGLGYGAQLLAPLFRRPLTWRVLDALIALTMWTIAALLLMHRAA
jgi:L-lysine exporter family protein LysE/ArgO